MSLAEDITSEMLEAETKPRRVLETFDEKRTDYTPEELDLFADALLAQQKAKDREEISEVGKQILLYLRDVGTGSRAEIAASAGLDVSWIRKNIPSLEVEGFVEKCDIEDKKGAFHYCLVEGVELPSCLDRPEYLTRIQIREEMDNEVYGDETIDPSINSGLYRRAWVAE